jgi:putative heme degradation protein
MVIFVLGDQAHALLNTVKKAWATRKPTSDERVETISKILDLHRPQ